MALIKAGALNDRSWLSPTVEIWCDSAQPWLPAFEHTQRFVREM